MKLQGVEIFAARVFKCPATYATIAICFALVCNATAQQPTDERGVEPESRQVQSVPDGPVPSIPTPKAWEEEQRQRNEKVLYPGVMPTRSQAEERDHAESDREAALLLRRESEVQRAHLEVQLAEARRQIKELMEELKELERDRQLPPIKDGRVVAYKPKRVSAAFAAEAIESLLGSQTVRFAVDEKMNALIAFGKDDALAAVDQLLERLDEQADASKETGQAPAAAQAAAQADEAPRSLLLRVFWLADGLPEDEGQDAATFLPQSVLKATERLGLTSPRLVAQTVNSLAVNSEEAVTFTTAVPAVISEMSVGLNCEGRVKLIEDDRVRVEINLNVGGPISCNLSGSLASPLGHYMVLGTANSVVSDAAMAGHAGMMGGGYGAMEGGMRGRGGYGGEFGGYGGEFGGRGGYGRGEIATEEGGDPAAADAAKSKPAAPSYTTSRFAFVVQAIEGESFPASDTGKRQSDENGAADPFAR